MFEKIQKVFIIILLTGIFLVGLLCVYRATLTTKNMTVVVDKVINKKILYFTSVKGGRHYCLAFKLANKQNKIAINLGTKSQADNDSAFYFIDTGKVYKFYLDPTVPTDNGINWGIHQIDFDNKEVYKKPTKLDLFLGILISLISLTGIILILKSKKKNSS
jgi:hypothetical protein